VYINIFIHFLFYSYVIYFIQHIRSFREKEQQILWSTFWPKNFKRGNFL